jgi:hypothetical protein
LGEFSPLGDRFLLSVLRKLLEVAKKKLATFFVRKNVHQFLPKKMSWAALWAIFHKLIWSLRLRPLMIFVPPVGTVKR